MKSPKLFVNIFLTLAAIGMAYYLYYIIQQPIIFERSKKVREEALIQRLKDAREAQIAYKDLTGGFAHKWENLIDSIKYADYPQIKIIGNPDDTTQAVIYDTTYIPLKSRVFEDNYVVDSLKYIPYTGGKEIMSINAGEITVNKVNVQVFEIRAPERKLLNGLNKDYIDPDFEYRVGSMSQATYSGNWE
ncbi:MAG: hypothetical protein WD048_12095 [Chitinophagales bacterium]